VPKYFFMSIFSSALLASGHLIMFAIFWYFSQEIRKNVYLSLVLNVSSVFDFF